MRFEELRRFRRTEGGQVPREVLDQLELPMPADVLEQFVFDHGLLESFQSHYGNLDLHSIAWASRELTAVEIIQCEVKLHGFDRRVEQLTEATRHVLKSGWHEVHISDQALKSWRDRRTWRRRPIIIERDLLSPGTEGLHLVEGHTRVGCLIGLVECGYLDPSSLHGVWIGAESPAQRGDEKWRSVLKTERMPFLNWLIDRMGDRDELGDIGMRLVDVQYASIAARRVEGDDLDAVLAYAKHDRELKGKLQTIIASHATWLKLAN